MSWDMLQKGKLFSLQKHALQIVKKKKKVFKGYKILLLHNLHFCFYLQVAYTALFPEDIPSNKVILKISAKDADIGSNGDIRYSLYGPGNNKFFLDPENGKVTTKYFNIILFPQHQQQPVCLARVRLCLVISQLFLFWKAWMSTSEAVIASRRRAVFVGQLECCIQGYRY